MNVIKDVETFIAALEAIIKLVEAIDPNAAQNPIVIKIEEALQFAKKFNL